jgi:hydroxymethylpyrimidine/phosphomethylpyrimidine kinase
VDPAFVAVQMEAVLDDIGADCIKTGMLHSAETLGAVARTLERRARGVPVVVDPVMVAKGGVSLLGSDAVKLLVHRMVPLAALLTPNLPEAEVLTGRPMRSLDDMQDAADRLLGFGAAAVLVKGGHLGGERIVDLLRTVDGEQVVFEDDRIATRSTHGTGCTLASAIAAGIAEGLTLRDAVERARRYVREAIRAAPGLGRGHGPLDHGWQSRRPDPGAVIDSEQDSAASDHEIGLDPEV